MKITGKISSAGRACIAAVVWKDEDGFAHQATLSRPEPLGPGDQVIVEQLNGHWTARVVNAQMQYLNQAANAGNGYLAGSLGLGLGLGDPFHRGDR